MFHYHMWPLHLLHHTWPAGRQVAVTVMDQWPVTHQNRLLPDYTLAFSTSWWGYQWSRVWGRWVKCSIYPLSALIFYWSFCILYFFLKLFCKFLHHKHIYTNIFPLIHCSVRNQTHPHTHRYRHIHIPKWYHASNCFFLCCSHPFFRHCSWSLRGLLGGS